VGEIIPADKPGVISLPVRQPAGVVLGIAPWNAPVIPGVRAIAAPFASGNTVIRKSSEVCPATHHLIGQIMNDAGFPKGVVNVISNARSNIRSDGSDCCPQEFMLRSTPRAAV
jgi:vanillin dehydrogenase